MIDWEVLKYVPGVIGALTGPIALWWQYQTYKERQEEKNPKARLSVGAQHREWVSCIVEFTNPLGEHFDVFEMKGSGPRDLILCPRIIQTGEPDEKNASRTVPLSWVVKRTEAGTGKAAAKTTIFLRRHSGQKLNDVTIIFSARKTSGHREELKIPAKVLQVTATLEQNEAKRQ